MSHLRNFGIFSGIFFRYFFRFLIDFLMEFFFLEFILQNLLNFFSRFLEFFNGIFSGNIFSDFFFSINSNFYLIFRLRNMLVIKMRLFVNIFKYCDLTSFNFKGRIKNSNNRHQRKTTLPQNPHKVKFPGTIPPPKALS